MGALTMKANGKPLFSAALLVCFAALIAFACYPMGTAFADDVASTETNAPTESATSISSQQQDKTIEASTVKDDSDATSLGSECNPSDAVDPNAGYDTQNTPGMKVDETCPASENASSEQTSTENALSDNTSSTSLLSSETPAVRASVKSYTADLSDGNTYVLFAGTTSNKALDVSGASEENGANVQQYTLNRTAAQQWIARFTNDGFVTFINVASGKALDVAGAIAANGTNVWQYVSNGTRAQEWNVTKNSNGTYTIATALTGPKTLVLDIANGSSADFANVQLYQSNGTKAQQWTLFDVTAMREELARQATENKENISPGTYYLASSIAIGKVADISNGSSANGANAQLYVSNGTSAQQWTVSYDSSGFATLQNSSGKALDVENARATNGANIWQYTPNNTAAQKWVFLRNGDNTYRIVSALWSDMVLDVAGGSSDNGANLQLYVSNGTSAQSWSFVPITISIPTSSKIDEGWYTISSALDTTYVFDIVGAGKANGTPVQLYQANGTPAQFFNVVAYGASYRLIAGISSTSIELNDTTRMPGASVRIYSRSSSAKSQLFSIVKNTDSTVSFVNASSGMALTIVNGEAFDGASIQAQVFDPAVKAQRFYMTRITSLIDEGFVTIVPILNASSVVSGNQSQPNAAGATIQTRENGYLQKWNSTLVDGLPNTYTIESLATGLFLEETAAGTVVQSGRRSDAAQYWVASIVQGAFTLKNAATGEYLGFDGSAANEGTVLTTDASTSESHRFEIRGTSLIEDAVYTLANGADLNNVLDVANGSLEDKANVQVYVSNETGAQKWRVTKLYGDVYTIVNAKSWRALDVDNADTEPGTNVQQYQRNGTPAQQWTIIYSGAGLVRITSALGDTLVLAPVAQGSSANVAIVSDNGETIQRWQLQPTNYDLNLSEEVLNSLTNISVDGVTKVGIDVSKWQGSIDWARVKAAGIDFAILRCGFGSTTGEYGSMDSRFREYVQGCKANGIDIGVYLYSYTDNAEGATREAEFTLSLLSSLDLKPADLKYGVYYDVEEPSLNTASMKQTLRDMCANYCNRIMSAGYEAGVYSSLSWWRSYYDGDSRFDNWNKWIAQWGPSRCSYSGTYQMWQCKSTATIPGISGNVDLDLYYA